MSGSDAPGGPGEGDPDDDVAVAGEYVLGLLTPDEIRAFEARLDVDPEFRALVARWSEDLVALADAIPAVAPPRGAEAALMARLFPEERRRGWLGRFGLAPALAAFAAVAVVLFFALDGFLDRPGAPTLTAEIATEDRALVIAAAYDPTEGALRVERVAGEVPEGGSQELWLIAGDAGPVSLGLLPEAGVADIPVPPDLRPGLIGGTLAVSLEAFGGSTTGVPGPVLAAGPITEL